MGYSTGVYCTKISPNNCTINDEIAVRSRDDEDEALKYFVDGLYTGHFAATEKNDCGANPDTCTGHMANVPCSWGNYATPQAFHLNISVESDGNLEPNGAYGYSSLLDIYSAANATGSNVLMVSMSQFHLFTDERLLLLMYHSFMMCLNSVSTGGNRTR